MRANPNSRRPFETIMTNKPRRSMFDLSYSKLLTCNMMEIIPIMCDEVVPNDFFQIANNVVLRTQPLTAPILHDIDLKVYYFFAPFRLLWNEAPDNCFEQFITKGITGDIVLSCPIWEPTDTTVGSLWDYIGFPTGVDPDGAYPLDYPRRAYNWIWNNYFRDENLQTEVDLDNESILYACWPKDRLTSAQLEQQRGTAPSLPISGTTSAVWASDDGTSQNITAALAGAHLPNSGDHVATFNNNTVDLAAGTVKTFDIADLRLAFQIQRWMELNQRAGVRYNEFVIAHHGVDPGDQRVQRPEYIGGSKVPLLVSEVLQTSKTEITGTPQGNLAGHGIAVSNQYCGKYHVKEYGLIMGLMVITPKSVYSQGINRQWLRRTPFDYFFPEFVNLSEQAIIQAEVCANDTLADNQTLFGYQGQYDEMRVKDNMVCGEMRDTLAYWHLAREFDPNNPPILDENFVSGADVRKDIFAVSTVDTLIVNFGNIIKASRPIPIMAMPGLIDHV